MAVELNPFNFDPRLDKPKWVWKAVHFLKIVNKHLTIVNKFLKIEKNLPPLKPILAFKT